MAMTQARHAPKTTEWMTYAAKATEKAAEIAMETTAIAPRREAPMTG
jgi:hypothetical protein